MMNQPASKPVPAEEHRQHAAPPAAPHPHHDKREERDGEDRWSEQPCTD